MNDRAHDTGGHETTTIGYRDLSQLSADRPRGQPMRGFDPDYVDIVDYIIRCTHRIWEEKGVGLIDTHYRHNVVVYTPMGVAHGREAVVAATLQMLLAFPDRRLYGDAVVWSGNDEEGFYSSHRITNTGTNSGPSAWGPATGRRCVWQGIADCVVFENRVCEEWLVRDDMHLVRQLGFDPHQIARALAAADAARGVEVPVFGDIGRSLGQHPRPIAASLEGADAATLVAWHVDEIWNGRMLNRVRDLYAPQAVLHAPVGRLLRGHAAITGFLLAVLAAVPDGALAVQHTAQVREARGQEVALRWTFTGSHDGPGLFGPPTHRRVEVIGISHFRVVAGRVVEEWTVFDELAVLKQIYLQLG